MTYYTDLTREIAMLCLSMSLGNAKAFVQAVDQQRLTQTEYIAVLKAAAIRIGGCGNYDSVDSYAAASRITEHALANYDPKNGDQTLDLMNLITAYMDYPPDSFPADKVAEGMLSVFATWMDVWVGAEAAIDPHWDANAVFPPFEHPSVIDGQTPKSIVNVQVRSAYEHHLAQKQIFLARQRNQLLLRRALDHHRDRYTGYIREIPKTLVVTDWMRSQAGRVSDQVLIQAMTQPAE